MKTLIVLFLAVTLGSGFIYECRAGGVGSGGGDVQLPDQVSQTDLIRAVQRSKPLIAAWLSHTQSTYGIWRRAGNCPHRFGEDCTLFARLFDGKPTVLEVVAKAQIEVRATGPCLDGDGNPNDGSRFGSRDGTICISVSNVRPKLRRDNYENQLAALVLHELSHLLGTSEPEAQRLQGYMLRDLSWQPFQAAWVQLLMFKTEHYRAASLVDAWASTVKGRTGVEGACKETREVLDRLYALRTGDHLFAWLAPLRESYFQSARVKLQATWNYLCSLDPAADPGTREMSGWIYAQSFGDRNRISASEYHGAFRDESSADVSLTRIVDAATLASEADGIRSIFDENQSWIDRFVNNEFVTY